MDFRLWVGKMWEEHKAEFEGMEGKLPDYTSKTYFNMYKWWLKREYKHRVNL